jgi:hypothetical protein
MLIFLMATSSVEQANHNDPRSAGLIQVNGFRWPERANSKPFNGASEAMGSEGMGSEAMGSEGVGMALSIARRLRPDEQESGRLHTQTRQNSVIDLHAVLALKRLFRQARPVFRLCHPERPVGRLTLCQLSA